MLAEELYFGLVLFKNQCLFKTEEAPEEIPPSDALQKRMFLEFTALTVVCRCSQNPIFG